MRYFAALLLVLCVQFLPGLGVGDAQAIRNYSDDSCWSPDPYGSRGCNRAEAYSQVASYRQEMIDEGIATPAIMHNTLSGSYYLQFTGSGGSTIQYKYWVYDATCDEGEVWQEATNTCFSSAECLAKPPLGDSKVSAPSAWENVCSDGCEFSQGSEVSVQFLDDDTGLFFGYVTGFKPTGNACAAGDPVPVAAEQPQECFPAPDNQTFCIKPTGEHCYSLTNGSGRQICWRPGETGEKAARNALQVRNGGTSATPPVTPPPPGDAFVQGAASVTKTSVVNGITVTTTTTNYVTGSGTDAGSGDASEPGDGSGSPGGGGDGEGGEGSASGGETCEQPPVCSGDPVGCALLAQQYLARCEANNLFGVDGADTDTGAGMAETADALWGDVPGGDVVLDESGFIGGARVCPAPPTFTLAGKTVTLDFGPLCDLGEIIAALVLLVALAQAAWILGEK